MLGNLLGLCRGGDVEGCTAIAGDDVRVRAVVEEIPHELESFVLVQLVLPVDVADLGPRRPVERRAAWHLPLIAQAIDGRGILAQPRLDVLAKVMRGRLMKIDRAVRAEPVEDGPLLVVLCLREGRGHERVVAVAGIRA